MENWENLKVPRARLEKTLEDHKKLGSSPDTVLIQNPGKAYAETMTDEELKAYIIKEVADVREQYELAKTGDKIALHTLRITMGMLLPNLEYLRRVGRLPEELSGFDPEKEFALQG